MEANCVYLVLTGDRGGDDIRFVTFDHKKAITIAKKFVKQENRKNEKDRKKWKGSTAAKFHSLLKKEPLAGDCECVFGEKLTERWSNGSRHVEITMFVPDKDYTPDWYYV